ncbi:MAG: sulfate adenylyltransferase subunit CysD [Acidobacteriaceae bacterium]|nr:sulfate adenylyltransferase subunit CysD [Acidobacteriaceae bacterium]MBV9780995.1 sulfate adenylyltransferase subunit CysD [Acidobacteriaceae bacterium]
MSIPYLRALESESIYILREAAAQFSRPAILYSIGKDSSVLLHLAQKAFRPAPIPFPALHVDTTFKFREMIEFRNRICAERGITLLTATNQQAIDEGANPFALGTAKCCAQLKTKALLDALKEHRIDAAIGGARRDEEKSRAKERVFSFRDAFGQWNPKDQRPELWNLFNGRLDPGESMRIFPLSNWTEIDVWEYIDLEKIPVVPLYFAHPREVIVRGPLLIPIEHNPPIFPGERVETVVCRFRTLGCTYCTGAIRSNATTVSEIVQELRDARRSERETRIIDHDTEGSMELKKREGYF